MTATHPMDAAFNHLDSPEVTSFMDANPDATVADIMGRDDWSDCAWDGRGFSSLSDYLDAVEVEIAAMLEGE